MRTYERESLREMTRLLDWTINAPSSAPESLVDQICEVTYSNIEKEASEILRGTWVGTVKINNLDERETLYLIRKVVEVEDHRRGKILEIIAGVNSATRRSNPGTLKGKP